MLPCVRNHWLLACLEGMMQKTLPQMPLHDKRFEYRNSAATDVTITWQKFGWTPKGKANERQDSGNAQEQRHSRNQAVRK